MLSQGDGAKISEVSELVLENKGQETLTALVFDLP